jgi:DHA1 family multidrug resistance protein-like MFS transporter
MIEIFRDSAFGKLLRIFSGTIILPYPEEAHELAWRTYLQSSAEAEQHEETTATSEMGLAQSYGLYPVISQASPPEPTETFSK